MTEQNSSVVTAAVTEQSNILPARKLLVKSWHLFKDSWLEFLKVYTGLLVGLLVLMIIFAIFFFVTAFATHGDNQSFLVVSNIILSLLGIIAVIFILHWVMVAQYLILKDLPNITAWRALKKSVKKVLPFVGLNLIVGLITFLGFLLLAVPGIYLTISLSFAAFILAIEDGKVFFSIKKSYQLVKGYWFTVFSRALVLQICLMAFIYLIAGLFILIPSVLKLSSSAIGIFGFVGTVVFYILLIPAIIISLMFNYYLYQEIKQAKEVKKIETDLMSGWKKFGLSLIIIFGLILFIGISVVLPLIKTFSAVSDAKFQPNLIEDMSDGLDPVLTSYDYAKSVYAGLVLDDYKAGFVLGGQHVTDGEVGTLTDDQIQSLQNQSFVIGYGMGFDYTCSQIKSESECTQLISQIQQEIISQLYN
ncbi:MAG: hypothetical protein JW816_03010 [Candidatus Buchananbacteria bacterium]|nr:hypothetical protein [Candidatus Buchananbacteria bacterium]